MLFYANFSSTMLFYANFSSTDSRTVCSYEQAHRALSEPEADFRVWPISVTKEATVGCSRPEIWRSTHTTPTRGSENQA